MNVDNTKEFTCLSLCSGYGGLELGLRRACSNLRTVAYVEVEAFACANLVAKMEKGLLDVAPIWTDIKTFNGWPFRKNIHIITVGYPCQPFSVAGKRKGTDDPRHLWPHIERIIEAVRPVWFFGENVSGHLAIGFPEVYRSLRNMGYAVEAGLFTAAECGAPHRRERLFILAYNGNGNTRKRWLCPQGSMRGIEEGREAQSAGTVGGQSNSRGGKELADTTAKGLHTGTINQKRQIARQSWPARPGQPQYEWEEPRVVGNSENRVSNIDKTQQNKSPTRTLLKRTITKNRQAQSRLGRAAYGTSCRVDRLRLLGNGVVPQQAEKAFRYLIKNFVGE